MFCRAPQLRRSSAGASKHRAGPLRIPPPLPAPRVLTARARARAAGFQLNATKANNFDTAALSPAHASNLRAAAAALPVQPASPNPNPPPPPPAPPAAGCARSPRRGRGGAEGRTRSSLCSATRRRGHCGRRCSTPRPRTSPSSSTSPRALAQCAPSPLSLRPISLPTIPQTTLPLHLCLHPSLPRARRPSRLTAGPRVPRVTHPGRGPRAHPPPRARGDRARCGRRLPAATRRRRRRACASATRAGWGRPTSRRSLARCRPPRPGVRRGPTWRAACAPGSRCAAPRRAGCSPSAPAERGGRALTVLRDASRPYVCRVRSAGRGRHLRREQGHGGHRGGRRPRAHTPPRARALTRGVVQVIEAGLLPESAD